MLTHDSQFRRSTVRPIVFVAALLAFVATILSTTLSAPLVANELTNPGFESGTTYWQTQGDCVLNIEPGGITGNGCRVSDRNASWMGLRRNLLPIINEYTDYQISIWIKPAGEQTQTYNLEIGRRDEGNSPTFARIDEVAAPPGEWTRLVGGYQFIPGSSSTQELYIIVNSINNFEAEFIVDDAEMLVNDWVQTANDRIDQIRKRDLEIQLMSGSTDQFDLELTQIRGHFPFGSAINHASITNPGYVDFFRNHFNYGTTEWNAQWPPVESTQGVEDYSRLDDLVEFINDLEIPAKAHAIFWSDPRFVPGWLGGLDNQSIRSEVEDRVNNVLTRYAGVFDAWDVCNEMTVHSFFRDRLGDEIRAEMFTMARDNDAGAKLFFNEFGIYNSKKRSDSYLDLVDQIIAGGGDPYGIGLQSHFFDEFVSPAAIENTLDYFSQANLPIWITEYDYEDANLAHRAIGLENFYRSAFSHPSVEGIIMWGFWAEAHWRDEQAALVDSDWTVNEAGQMYQSLLEEWQTSHQETISNGQTVELRAFHADYLATLTNQNTGAVSYHLFSLPKEPTASTHSVQLCFTAQNNEVVVYGAADDDNFRFDFNGRTLYHNGEKVRIPDSLTYDRLRVCAGTGNDRLNVTDNVGNDRYVATPILIRDRSDNFKLLFDSVETVSFQSQLAHDQITIFDSEQDDQFISLPNQSTMFFGNGVVISASDFRLVKAQATADGNDRAVIFDDPDGPDTAYADLETLTMRAGPVIRIANFFEDTRGLSSGDRDRIVIDIYSGSKSVICRPTQMVLDDGISRYALIGWHTYYAQADLTNNDVLKFIDSSDGNDSLVVNQDSIVFRGDEFNYRMFDFKNSDAVCSNSGDDFAVLRDSTGNDDLTVLQNKVILWTPEGTHTIRSFDRVNGISINGGSDSADVGAPNFEFQLIGGWNQ